MRGVCVEAKRLRHCYPNDAHDVQLDQRVRLCRAAMSRVYSACAGGRLISATLLTVLCVGSLPPVLVYAQTAAIVGDRPSCQQCRITIAPAVSLNMNGRNSKLSTPPISIVANSRGDILIARGEDGPPLVFDQNGMFLRSVGRTGSRPGQYKAASEITIGPRDTVFIMDRATGSVTVLDPRYELVRSAPGAPGSFSFTLSGDTTALIINASVPDPERFGNALHSLDLNGNYMKSFAAPEGAMLPGAMYPQMRWLTPRKNGGVWSITAMGRYEIEHWSSDGRLMSRLVRQPPWFPSSQNPQRTFRVESPRSPINMSITEDSLGYLWIITLVADSRWQEGVRANQRNGEEHIPFVEILDFDRTNDSVVEIIDPRTGTLVASQRFEQMWYRFAAPNLISRFRRQPDGSFLVDIHRVSLEGFTK